MSKASEKNNVCVLNHLYTIIYVAALSCQFNRIHVLSGILNDSISADQAEEKFLTNIQLAADECAKVLNE